VRASSSRSRPEPESIVESIPTGTVERSWRESYDNDRHWGVLVEPAGLTPEERATIEEKSIVYLGRRYGNVALVKHFLDGTLGWLAGRDVYLFRRLRLPWLKPSPLYNTCSWLVCWTHLHAAWRFHGPEGALPCHRTTPDDLWDDAFEHRPDAYLIRAEIGVRPGTVSAAHIAKIERDLGAPSPAPRHPRTPALTTSGGGAGRHASRGRPGVRGRRCPSSFSGPSCASLHNMYYATYGERPEGRAQPGSGACYWSVLVRRDGCVSGCSLPRTSAPGRRSPRERSAWIVGTIG